MAGLFGGLKKKRAAAAVAGETDAAFKILEDELVMADAGLQTAADIVRAARARPGDESPPQKLAMECAERLRRLEASLAIGGQKPFVIMAMGVNGGGKTTTLAKLCRRFALRGKKVLLAAGDTFRAAAREQLQEWAGKLGGVEVVSAADPGAAAYKGASEGARGGFDVVLIDTSGRLPSQKHLMAELGKIRRAVGKALPGAPHELLLVLDATLGRDTLRHLESFNAAAGVTGLALTKLDGTARGGFLLEAAMTMPRPVRFIGVGESADDLDLFNADHYARALAGLE